MKNISSSRVARVLGKIFNLRSWFDFERVRTFTLYVSNAYKRLFSIEQNDVAEKPVLTESFRVAQQKLNLTDKDLLSRQKALFRLALLMIVLAFFILLYTGYNFYIGAIRAGLLCLVVMMLAVVLGFRYHFWYYQIKNRKLGCSVKEWLIRGLLGAKE